jgi:hypothetical protein
MKNILEKTSLQYLNNIANYKSTFDIKLKIDDILTKYLTIIKEYLIVFNLKINSKMLKNTNFIFQKGFETITHVFETILLYTKNLELTAHHSQKAIYFFIEFTEQITDEQNVFLQLTTRDASMFVYKKTIFEINNDYKRNISLLSNKEQELINNLNIYINIYKLLTTNNIEFTNLIINNGNKINTLKINTTTLLLKLIEKMIDYQNNYYNKINIYNEVCKFLDNSTSKEYIKNVTNAVNNSIDELINNL